ncbi:uncharacterized protein LOC136079281 [Hydra vulgaris]|uniref:Uncharacterized protein LOC136079281 n=1 Tax=Hydra vulgaris TaxID=6087 RepID=A0ABM4BPN7_HYDVU
METVWKFTLIDAIFSSVGVFICGIGIFILVKVKKNRIDRTQWYIITNLCIFDVCSCVTIAISSSLYLSNSMRQLSILNIFQYIFILGYYEATLWLVFDRYLHIKLNLKYHQYWSKKKTAAFTLILWFFSILASILFEVFKIQCVYSILVLFDIIIIISSTLVYGFALKVYRSSKLKKRSFNARRPVFKGLLVSSLILFSYALLVVIPDILTLCTYNSMNSWNSYKFSYINCSYIVAMWFDAVVYVVVSPQSLIFLKNRRLSFWSSSTTSKSKNSGKPSVVSIAK